MIGLRSFSRPRLILLCSLLAGITLACGGWSSLMMGEPTTKAVTRADIAGVYSYKMMTRTVTVELDATGLFTITGSASLSGHGQWSINDQKWIVFAYVDRQTDEEFGWVADDYSGGFDIIGGELPDPDTYHTLDKIR